ncbi:MAG: indole-3-glycerol phosphate synthase TrpC [Deltaproteobacteria bacterium]|nr:indole-3-glycerol phosphate synthase TrpC [Deltaproteobacteria bacterium]
MAESILDRIVARRRIRLAETKARVPQQQMEAQAAATPVPPRLETCFETVSSAPHSARRAILAEIKKASPSRGVFREDFDPAGFARSYASAGAAGLSVLTEEDFFQGCLGYLTDAAKASGLPCLRKDFLFDPYQVIEARAAGASAILLIVAMLADADIRLLMDTARQWKLDTLVEVHDETELDRALAGGAMFIGINNRDLKTFDTDLAVTERLLPKIPASARVLSESGLARGSDLDRLAAAGAGGFLIGETFMRAADPGAELRRLLGECHPAAHTAAR